MTTPSRECDVAATEIVRGGSAIECRRMRIGLRVAAFCVLLAATAAHGVCPLDAVHFRVGASGAPYCTHNDIQSAIQDVGSCPVVIDITKEHTYTDQHLAISGRSVTLQGWGDGVSCYNLTQCIPFPCGAPADIAPLVTIDGGNGGRILGISDSNVTIRNLLLIHGDAGNSSGGAIFFSGAGNLNIVNSSLPLNKANYGGAIYMEGSGGNATLRLLSNTFMINNTALTSGGAIALNGSARLLVLSSPVWISSNHAIDGHGGGIAVFGPARADIGSAGFNGAGVVSGNDAKNGGGISVYDVGNGEGVLRTFADAAGRPTEISGNNAIGLENSLGGALYLIGASSACLSATRIDDSVAAYGAAIYENSYNGSSFVSDVGVYINGGAPARLGSDCGPETVASLGGKEECSRSKDDCSTIDANASLNADSSPGPGPIVEVNANLVAQRLRMRGNTAFDLIATPGGDLDLVRCLLTDNSVSGPLFYGYNKTERIHSCTIANNSIGDGFVMEFNEGATSVDLAYDIVDQPGRYTVNWVASSGESFDVSYMLSNNIAGLPLNNPSIVQGTPTFVDAVGGNYRLAAIAQPALDFGQGANYDYVVDLDGFAAPVDLVAIPNYLSGAADLGAYERQNLFNQCGAVDSLFCDGFQLP
jgi:hypothetical protein